MPTQLYYLQALRISTYIENRFQVVYFKSYFLFYLKKKWSGLVKPASTKNVSVCHVRCNFINFFIQTLPYIDDIQGGYELGEDFFKAIWKN